MSDVQSVIKSGETWLEQTIDRMSDGLEVWVRVDPRVEEFMKGAGKTDSIAIFGKTWLGVGGKDIKVYRNDRPLDTMNYTIDNVCGMFGLNGNGQFNLSFLRLEGISTPDGVRFKVLGAYNKPQIIEFSKGILLQSRQLFRDYITPVHISLRISSQEL